MKELQNFLYKHMDALKHHKRYVAMLTALSLLVSFMVPLILIEPADSMTKQKLMLLSDTSNMAMVSNLNNGQDGNNGYSKGQLSEVTLLIGEFTPGDYETKLEWVEGCTTAAEVVEAAKREYFLGIASDFCVFLNENFTITNSDAEGRVAVGGTVNFKNANDGWNYQIGNGDYGSGTDLKDTDNYKGISNFAHLITAGYVQGINTVSVSSASSNTYQYNDFYKRFVVSSNADLSDTTKFYHKGNNAYNTACNHNSMYINETACFYGADLIDFDETFLWLEGQSEKLSRKTANGNATFNSDNTILTLNGNNIDAETIYFDLSEWKTTTKRIEFINVPDDANLVINCGSTIVSIDDIDDTDNNGSESYNNLIRTSINGVEINNKGTEAEKYTSNNHKKSEQILYNFYNAEKVHIDVNFNGTIFAPKADVFSGNVKADGTYGEECNGHLSGSLIAKSFTGGLEFGYRPYRGGTDILGSTAGYVVPFDKFVDDLDNNPDNNTALAGATFEIKDEHENIVDTWTSTEETSYITFPTELDFAGGKNYTDNSEDSSNTYSVTHTYTISEKSAPEGYITTDKKYKIVITETVDLNYLLLVDNGTIPTRVTVNLELYEIDDSTETDKGTRTLKIRDGYDENQHVQRIIEVQKGENKDYFILTIENGNITKIEKVDNNSAFEELLSPDDEVNVSFNAVTYSGADIQADEAITEEPITVDPYPYAYTPENLLTDYQVVAFNELRQIDHIVGAMAAKTFVSAKNVFGNAAKIDSYFENVGTVDFKQQPYADMQGNLADYALNNYFGSDKFYEEDNGDYYVYYQNKGDFLNIKGNNDNINEYIVKISNPYINFETAQSDVQTWSNNKKTEANAIKIESLPSDNIINIVVSNDPNTPNQNVIIPASVLKDLKNSYGYIRFVGPDNSDIDVEVLKKKGIVITISGELENDQGQDNFNLELDQRIQYKINGSYQSGGYPFRINNQTDDMQVNLYGMKVIWNFPDVDYSETQSDGNTVTKGKIKISGESCHIVAPKAYVLLGPGDGGVIAENVWVGSEIHYYPYYVNTNRTGDDVPEKENREEVNNGDSTGGSTGGGTNDDETNNDETPDVIEPQFPPITGYSATTITLTDNSKAQKLSDDYYYDPTSLMIMPLPDETPSFTNEYALVFKKQSDESTALAGATIMLQSGTISNGEFNLSTTHGADSTPPWEWGNETNTYSIPLKKIQVKDLDADVVYRFYEAKAPDNYEIAKPIYFVKTNNKTIRYTDDETKLSDINSWTAIEFSESNKSSNIITMTDYKKYGPEIKLSKVQNGSSNPLQGAEFELYAVDGDTLVYPLNDGTKLTSGSDGMIDFTKVFKANPDNCNSEYIKNGYLVPGEYYLKETKAPDKYEVPTDNMYFIVNEDYTVEAEKVEEPGCVEFTFDTAHAKEVKAYGTAEAVTSMEIYVTGASTIELWDGPFAYGTDYGGITANVIDGVATFTNVPPTITNFKIQNKDNYDSGLTVTAVKVYSTPIPPTAYTLNSDPQLSAGNAYYSHNETVSVTSGKDYTVPAGSEYANRKVTKIEFNFSNLNDAGIQVKGNNTGGYDTYEPKGTGLQEYIPSSENADRVRFDSSGNFLFTWWNLTVNEIRFYVEGMESTGTCDLTVSTVKAYYLDGTDATAESINALTKKDNIIGLEVTLGGSGSGNIQVNDAWKATGVTAGETVTFGETNYTPPAAETGNSTLISVKDNTTDTLLVGNNQKGEKTNIKVVKVWSDSENLYNTRPNEIRVKLRRDGVDFNIPDTDSPILTLTAEKNWQAELKNLPSLKSGNVDDETAEYYQYSFVELDSNNNEIVPNGTLNCYTVSYGNPVQSGEFTITNTLKTTNIPVEKKWKNSDGSTATPNINQITVKLQKHNGSGYSDFLDKDGNPVTLVLSSNNNWAGKFTGIPEGQYQVVESVVPSGWTETRVTENGKTIITNTQKSGTLKLIKIWQNDTAVQRPQNITIKIYRTTTPPAGTTMVPSATKSENVTEDYARLLQYSLYFYDANMCGDEVTENSVYSWRNDCHTYDGEYAGGFHDAGDHAMFGLPQGFTASTLGWTYNEYKTTFDSLGLTNHYQLIMKEFCDFFVKSTKMSNGSVSDLLLDKGDAGTDHSYWGSPEAQTQGERGGLVWANSSNSGGNIAAEYAAALASYYLNFPNDSNSSTYLEYAKALYDYSNVKNSPRSIGGIYEDNSITDEQAWAAAWLYLATNEEQYKNDCVNKLNSINFDKRGHFWGEPALGAAIIYTTRIDSTNTTIKNKVTNFLNDKCTGDSFQVLDGWGSARHNTLLQLTALTYDKYQETSSYKDWCKKQMAFLLGDNTINGNNNGVCFVTGFKDGDSDTNNDSYLPQHPHHRAASGYNDWNIFDDAKQNGTNTQYKYAHTLIGALVGGPNGNSYNDNIDDTVCNEVAIDYNAGLVGAAAALYSVYEKGNTVNADVMKADGLEIKDGKTIYEEQSQAASVNIEDIMNTSAMSFKRNAVSVLAKETRTITVDVNKEISKTNANGLKQEYEFKLSDYIPNDAQVKAITVNFSADNDITIYNECGYFGLSVDQAWESDWWYEAKLSGSWGKTGSLRLDTSQFSQYIIKTNNMKFAIYGGTPDIVKIDTIEFECEVESTGPTVTITNPTTDSQTLVVGDTLQLTATSSDNSNITWNSSNTGAVQVDSSSDQLTAVGTGDATITATSSSGATDTVNIHVDALQISVNNKTDSATFAKDDTPTFTVNGQTEGHSFKWTSSNSEVLKINENTGQAEALKAGENITITVVKDGNESYKDTITVNVTSNFGIEVSPTVIRPGKSAQLGAINADGDVTYTEESDYLTIEEIDGIKYAKASDSVSTETQITITGNDGYSNSTCQLTINPIGNPSISAPDSKNRIGIGETLQLTASNILGTASWRLEDEDTSILTVDENGLVTGVSTGTTTIIVEDTDGTIGTYEITVAELAADPGLPDETILYTTVTLTSADLVNGNWEKIVNLPIEDENGKKYYYYIEEVTVNDVVNGNGGKYMPIKYEGQGVTLNEVGSETPEISVTNRLTQTIQGQLPSTGGSGVKTYYYLGGAIMLLGIAGFTGLKRRERKRREE